MCVRVCVYGGGGGCPTIASACKVCVCVPGGGGGCLSYHHFSDGHVKIEEWVCV